MAEWPIFLSGGADSVREKQRGWRMSGQPLVSFRELLARDL